MLRMNTTTTLCLMINYERLKEVAKELRCPNAGDSKLNYAGPIANFLGIVRPTSVLEIGSYLGVSTEVFCLLCDKVVAVDPCLEEDIFLRFKERLKDYSNLEVHVGYSPETLYKFPTDTFDMCYIDGNHNTDAVRRDIRECKRIVKPGYLLAGHDYGHIPSVTAGVLLEIGREPDILLPDSSWIAINAS